MGKANDFNFDGCKALCAAVVERAVKDYRSALRKLHKKPHDRDAIATVEECERFFRRDMGMYSDIDGESVIRAIRKRVGEEMQ